MYYWAKTVSLATSIFNYPESQIYCRRKSYTGSYSYPRGKSLANFVKGKRGLAWRRGKEKIRGKRGNERRGWNLARENNDPSIQSTIINCSTQLELSTPLLAYGWTNDVPVSCRIDRSADRHHGSIGISLLLLDGRKILHEYHLADFSVTSLMLNRRWILKWYKIIVCFIINRFSKFVLARSCIWIFFMSFL